MYFVYMCRLDVVWMVGDRLLYLVGWSLGICISLDVLEGFIGSIFWVVSLGI